MRSTASLIIAAFLAGSVVAAENRPRIYYPRQVNRRYTNETVTTTSSSSKRQASTTGDDNQPGNPLIQLPTNGNGNIIDLPGIDLGGVQIGNPTTPGALANSTATSTRAQSDITISPTVRPTTTGSSDSATETTTEKPGLGGVISSLLGGGDNDSSSTSAAAATTSASDIESATATASATASATVTDTATGTATATGSVVPTDTAATSADPTTTSGGGLGLSLTLPSLTLLPSTLLPSTLLPTLLPDPTTTDQPTTQPTVIPTTVPGAANNTEPAPTSSTGGLAITLPTLLPTLLDPTTTQPPTTAPPQATITPQEPTNGSVNTTVPSSTGGGLSLPITLPSLTLLPPASSSTEPPVVSSTEGPVVTPSASSSIDLFPTVSVPIPTTDILPPLGNGTTVSSTSISIPTSTSGTFIPTGSGSTSAPVTTTGSASTSGEPTSGGPSTTPTFVPPPVNSTSSSTESVAQPPTTTPAFSSPTILPNTTVPAVTSSVPVTPSSSPVTITSSTFTGTSVQATATITDTSESWLPTTILMQPSTTLSTGSIVPTATGLPSNLPQALTPWEVPPEQPEGTTLIQISFLYGVNYQFLVAQPMAAAQLFQHLPEALSFAGGFNKDKSVMHSIVPYDTLSTLGYITSQALVYHPTDEISQLAADIKLPQSVFYQNPSPIVHNLTMEVNSAIDITLGAGLDGLAGGSGPAGPFPTNTGPSSNDPFNNSGGSGENTSSSQKAQTAGIALGSAAVASAYGAAMFILARRYKRKRQGHKRNSSISSNSEMRQTASPALMGGALLSRDFTGYGGVQGNPNANANTRHSQGSGHNSARTAIISAPVAAENSLGWN